MATIKIYDTAGINSIELLNAGEYDENEMLLKIDHDEHQTDYLYFNISKDDARELIRYLKEQFHI